VIKRYIILCILLFGVILGIYFSQKNRNTSVSTITPVGIVTSPTLSAKEENKWTLVATGDVIPARSVNYKTIVYKDFTWAWKYIAPILQEGDITVINVESPLLSDCPITNDGFVFCGDKRHIEGLEYAGVDVVTLANNHIGNYGKEGIDETVKLLRSHGMDVTGINEDPPIRVINNIRIGFLAYNDVGGKEEGVSWADIGVMEKEIQKLRNNVDVLVVSMSWGEEYTATASARQKELAHFIIDSGADLIIGNHPHWIQPPEQYSGKYIMYAHGNTIFDQMWSEETKIGVIGKYTFSGLQLIQVEFIPTYIQDYGQPTLLTGDAKEKVLQQF
jgi:poly-gamma-glutamate synthesis protein (capsule biosynthesis protein)